VKEHKKSVSAHRKISLTKLGSQVPVLLTTPVLDSLIFLLDPEMWVVQNLYVAGQTV